jgi:hypothetical protein
VHSDFSDDASLKTGPGGGTERVAWSMSEMAIFQQLPLGVLYLIEDREPTPIVCDVLAR